MSGMDGAKESARRNAYTKIKHVCACGRTLRGNLAVSHLRACETNLAERGWPLEKSMRESIWQVYYPTEPTEQVSKIIAAVERGLADIYLQRRRSGNKQPMRWIEYRDTIWELAEAAKTK